MGRANVSGVLDTAFGQRMPRIAALGWPKFLLTDTDLYVMSDQAGRRVFRFDRVTAESKSLPPIYFDDNAFSIEMGGSKCATSCRPLVVLGGNLTRASSRYRGIAFLDPVTGTIQ